MSSVYHNREDITLPGETWKAVQGFPGYIVSDLGRFGSYWHFTSNLTPWAIKDKVRIIKGTPQTIKGYYRVTCRHPEGVVTKALHRLVLEAFVGPCPEGMEACHWDDDPINNKLSNLRWDTKEGNIKDKFRNGLVLKGSQVTQSKLTDEIVMQIWQRLAQGETQKYVGQRFDVSHSMISRIQRGESWKHIDTTTAPAYLI